MQATVVKNTGSHYLLSALPLWAPFPAVLAGKIRLKDSAITNPVAVGDIVEYTEAPSNEEMAVITSVLPRTNYIIRRSTNLSRQAHIIASNLDLVINVVTIDFPEVKLPFLDRMLVTSQMYGIKTVIVLSKMDLFLDNPQYEEKLRRFKQIYSLSAGYTILEVSAKTGFGMNVLADTIRDRKCLLTGVSGVGKSSIIKALDPSLEPRVGELSKAFNQGVHTTTFYEMYPVSLKGGSASNATAAPVCADAFVIDAPGLRGFGLVDIDKADIALYFPEMLRLAPECRFTPCTHTHEPGCAVKVALEDGSVTAERYESYLGMLEDDEKYR